MYKRLFLEIITPDSKIYEGNIALVKVPGSKGSFEVLLNHAPIISTLDSGEIKIVDAKFKETFIEISGGVIEVKKNNVIILIEKV